MTEIIDTPNAPKPIGPYSQAVKSGNLIFLSGQIAIDPSSGQIINDSVSSETNQIMKNIEAVLLAAGQDLSSIIKTSIFLTDMNYFPVVNEEYAKWFNSNFPARETVQVAGLPKGVRIEISVIATVK
ncbi:MAG: RidA family protein [Bacteroidia bacterium]